MLKWLSYVTMSMNETVGDILVMMHIINETFSTFVDWLSDVFMQVGLAFIILYGYLRHWVSEIFQCHSCYGKNDSELNWSVKQKSKIWVFFQSVANQNCKKIIDYEFLWRIKFAVSLNESLIKNKLSHVSRISMDIQQNNEK